MIRFPLSDRLRADYDWLLEGKLLPEGYLLKSPGYAVKKLESFGKSSRSFTQLCWCPDCNTPEPPMVVYHDHIWQEAVPGGKGMHCMFCVEKRLGREITLDDLKDLPVNYPIRLGYHMRMRNEPTK